MPSSSASLVAKRRTAVAEMLSGGKSVAEIHSHLNEQGIRNPKTNRPYSSSTVSNDIRLIARKQTRSEAAQTINAQLSQITGQKQPLSETIGQWTYTKPLWQSRILLHVDTTYKDLVFWDALRRGTAPGYELSGPALCLSTAQTIASYAYGKGINASLVQAAIPSDERRTTVHEAALSEANGKPTQNLRNAEKTTKQAGGKPAPIGVS